MSVIRGAGEAARRPSVSRASRAEGRENATQFQLVNKEFFSRSKFSLFAPRCEVAYCNVALALRSSSS